MVGFLLGIFHLGLIYKRYFSGDNIGTSIKQVPSDIFPKHSLGET